MNASMTRRTALKITGTAALTAAGAGLAARTEAAEGDSSRASTKGRIRHSVCKWCYRNTSLEDLCKAAGGIGLSSIELLDPEDWPTLKKHDLVCAMCNGPRIDGIGGIEKAFNRVEHHEILVPAYEERIKEVAKAGFQNVICFSGNRAGLDDEQGLENCAAGLKRIMAAAEKQKINVCMELLNSKVNHKDYQCDHTVWGVELCKRVGSERFKLLYDIYHMQIMEGDVIRTVRDNKDYIAHYHTGGVPGRNEIDETQELYYPAIMRAIVETGFKGFVAQEFIPKRFDPLAALKQGVTICDV